MALLEHRFEARVGQPARLGGRMVGAVVDAARFGPRQGAERGEMGHRQEVTELPRGGLARAELAHRAVPQADLGEGRIHVLLTSLAASAAPVQTGKARFIAIVNPTRAAVLPAIPTARELGYAELEINGLAGIFAGNSMSEMLRDRIAADMAVICKA